MSVTDLIALLSGFTGIITAIGVLIANIQQNKKTAALLDYRMSQVERKLDEHNGYSKKISEIELALVGIQKDLSYLRGERETNG